MTKTDKVDAHTIASMIMSDVNLKSYSDTSYHNEELKSLTRYRFDKVKERAKLKQSVSRLVCILFPELENLVSTLHIVSVYTLLPNFHLLMLLHLHISPDLPICFLKALRADMAKTLRSCWGKLQETLSALICRQSLWNWNIPSSLSVSWMQRLKKLLAYAGLSPSTYQSDQLDNSYSHMEKRGSRYLRYALYNATKYVCHWEETFRTYLAKKRAEGKHYNVALSHTAKKLVRTIYAMEKSRQPYTSAS